MMANVLTICRKKAAANITIALACDDFKAEEKLEAGDFVGRGLQGASPSAGALLIAAEPRLGQRLRFLVSQKTIVLLPQTCR